MKVDEDCSHHMFVTTPFPKFADPTVKERTRSATGVSAHRCCEQLNKKEMKRVECIAYHSVDECRQREGGEVPWLLVRGASQESSCSSGLG